MKRTGSSTYNFIGEYEHNVDSKNRVILPSSIRKALDDDARLILAPAIEPCLVLFPYERWEEFLTSEELQGNTVDTRKFRRALASKANETKVDSQGRILIPDALRDLADIDDTVTVVGNVDRVELWSPEELDEFQRSIPDEELKQIEEKMFSGRG